MVADSLREKVRIALFYCAAPLSGAFGGLLATGLARIEYGGYNRGFSRLRMLAPINKCLGWPWIFFIEGIITVCVGLLAICFMPHTPKDAKFLTEEERAVALHRMKLDSHGATTQEDVGQEHFQWRWVRMALLSPNTIICSLAWFFLLVPLYVSMVGRCLNLQS